MEVMKRITHRQRVAVVVSVTIAGIVAAFLCPPIPQDSSYNHFADVRAWAHISNFADVVSNVPFFFVGAAGILFIWRLGKSLERSAAWLAFFAGVLLTAFGSSYYHLAPDNHRLIWDRLPMTIAFMSLFAAVVGERINLRAGDVLLPLCLALGVGSVLYWKITENAGHGDLRPYGLVQFLPMLLIPLILVLFPARHKGTKYMIYSFAFYVAAKIFEYFDAAVMHLTHHAVSGHTIKHLLAAAGAGCLIGYVRRLQECYKSAH